MQAKPALIFIFSIITACLSIYRIFVKAIGSSKSADNLINNSHLLSSQILLLDYSFWMWTILAWISVYLLIKNYLILNTH